MALWAQVDEGIDAAAWARAGEREDVLFRDSRAVHFEQRDASFLRLGFSYHNEAELDEAVRRMARALIRERSARLVRAPLPIPRTCIPARALTG
jgi:GntR family transcriptional regulator/MocR family aminotransferase